MKKKLSSILNIILPNKSINYFTLFLILLGIISGTIFLITLSSTDKELVTEKIGNFMTSISTNNINNLGAFKNALIENSIFVIVMWLFGISIFGVIVNIFLCYLKGFIAGFSISSFIMLYRYKGIIASFIYLFPTVILKFIITLLISVYSFTVTSILFKSIFNKESNILLKKYMKKYLYVLIICLVLATLSALSEAFLFPSIMKLVVNFFI